MGLRGEEQHLFTSFLHDRQEKVSLIDVDPAGLPAGEYEVLVIALDDSGNRAEQHLGKVTVPPSRGETRAFPEASQTQGRGCSCYLVCACRLIACCPGDCCSAPDEEGKVTAATEAVAYGHPTYGRINNVAAPIDIIGAVNDNSLSFDGAIQTCEDEHEGRARVLW